jgi:hypothetical protein
MIFGVSLAALGAAIATQTVAVLPELHAFTVASLAVHEYTLQQALAVVKDCF